MNKCPDCGGKRWKVRRIIKLCQCTRCAFVREETKNLLPIVKIGGKNEK